MKSNKFWLAVLGIVVIVSAVSALLIGQAPATHARVYRDNALIDEFELSAVSEPFFIAIGGDRGFNEVEVERGRIRMFSADCPDGLCVRQGWISDGLMPIVCLPNRIIIRLDSGSSSNVDAIVG